MHYLIPALVAVSYYLTPASAAKLAGRNNVFTVNCRRLTVQRSDPIVSPGGTSGQQVLTHFVKVPRYR